MKLALSLMLAMGGGSAVAADDPNAAIAAGVINIAASMNEMALACKHMSASEIDAAKAKQKTAALADLKVSAALYDKQYAEAAAGFKKQWATASAAQHKQSCDKMKNIPKQ